MIGDINDTDPVNIQTSENPGESPKNWEEESKVFSTFMSEQKGKMGNIVEELKKKEIEEHKKQHGFVFSDTCYFGDDIEDQIKENNATSEDDCNKLGITGISRTYLYVTKFVKQMKKRIRNNKMKRSVVEEIIKTETSYHAGINWMVTWKRKIVDKELVTDEEAERIF